MRPSRYIMNSDYATLKNDAETTLTVTIPNSFVLSAGVKFSAQATAGQKSAGMRWRVASSKYPGVNLVSPTFTIPCKANYTMAGQSYSMDTVLVGFIYRSAAGTVRMDIIPNFSAIGESTTITECGQTITATVQTFISPFEA